MGSEADDGKAGNPRVPLAAGWPGGLHAGLHQLLGEGCCCCYGDQGEGYYYCCCSQVGSHHCLPALQVGRSGGLCGDKEKWSVR